MCFAALVFLTVCSHLGSYGWQFDLLSHFRVQYAALWVFGVLFWGVLRAKAWTVVALLMSFVEGYQAFPFIGPSASLSNPKQLESAEPPTNAGRTIRFGALNVRTSNRQFERAREEILKWSPDLIVLTEVDQGWLDSLTVLKADYPHFIGQPRSNNFGIALYSKLPLRDPKFIELGKARLLAIDATVEVAGVPIRVFGAHVLPPMSDESTAERNLEIKDLTSALPAGQNVVVLGDFNITPFSVEFKKFLASASLTDSLVGQGWQPTWPTHFPFPSIAIDHCLYRGALDFQRRSTGQPVGSDHLPIFADFIVR